MVGSKRSNSLLLLAIALAPACGRRSSARTVELEPGAREALGVVDRCRTDAKRCQDYAASTSASTVCDQEFRSCLAGLVQEGSGASEPAPVATTPRGCIEDVRSCLVAMSAPSTCATRASECFEASGRRAAPSNAADLEGQGRP